MIESPRARGPRAALARGGDAAKTKSQKILSAKERIFIERMTSDRQLKASREGSKCQSGG